MFIEIDFDPNDPDMRRKRHISLDQIQEVVIFGPVFRTYPYMDFSETEDIIDEKLYQEYKSTLEEKLCVYHFHILLKTGEVITRYYDDNRMADLKKIYVTLRGHSVILDDMVTKGLSGKIKIYTEHEEFEESENPKSRKYRQIEIEASADLGDERYKFWTKVVDLAGDIFKTLINKSNNTEDDIDTVATEIMTFASDLQSSEDLVNSNPPAVRVIDCVLSLNRPYKTFVVPRLNAFMGNHPEIRQVTELADLMASYPTPHAFVQQELNYNHEDRARILHEVVLFLCSIIQQTSTIPEEEALKQWAVQAQSQTNRLSIRGFGVAGFQYLCMLFGADTTKPDIYIIRFVSKLLNRNVSDLEARDLLKAACERVGVSVRAVDKLIWEQGEQGAK